MTAHVTGIVSEWTDGPIFFRKFVIVRVGESIPIHKHKRDHTMIALTSPLRVVIEPDTPSAREVILVVGQTLAVLKGTRHAVYSSEPDAYGMCMFVHNDLLGRVCESYVGNNAAYASVD